MNRDLEMYLSKCRDQYYKGLPIIPDEVYDRLVENTQQEFKIGHDTDSRFAHPFPMYSLQKVFANEGTPPDYGNNAVVATPKMDGAAVSLCYVDGIFHDALTRGDGKAGLDISDKIKHIVPRSLEFGKSLFSGLRQITGEIVAPKTIKNARNYAAGALNLKDVEEFKSRKLTFIVYGIQPYIGTYWLEDMKLLDNWFNVISIGDYNCFPQDGIVFRVDKYAYYKEMGFTAHHPRGAYALKTREKGVVTKLLDVVWNTGKSGVVAPVAILEPINIGGATISRATLHNIGFINQLDLEIGCSVEVIRSGEIIPRIVRRV
jgi:DNA ligase (NAD+)